MSSVIRWGAIMGPNPVIVHDIPVAIRRFSLKYVFRASELEDVVMPIPEPERVQTTRGGAVSGSPLHFTMKGRAGWLSTHHTGQQR